MSIRTKLILPLLLLAVILGSAGYILVTNQFATLEQSFVSLFVENKISEARESVNVLSASALQQAAAFGRMPEVVEAFELAATGDMNDENDPKGQQARELLRKSLAPVMQGYKDNTGASLQLHFHLPTARSLARMWRKQQTKRKGEWIDVSDDLSSFRQTVLVVNSTKKPVKGIEPGRGGFTIRGLAPVTAPDGRHLGSVEVLVAFGKVLETQESSGKTTALLFMNHDKLSITTQLQDPAKNPVLDNKFVLIYGQAQADKLPMVDVELLERAQQSDVIEIHGNIALGAYAVKDYNGDTIGVSVLAQDISAQKGMLSSLLVLVSGALILVVVLPLGSTLWVFQKSVMQPVRGLSEATAAISCGRLDHRVQVHANDEIGRLGHSVNTMAEGLEQKAALAKDIASGDLTGKAHVASAQDVLGLALQQMTANLNEVLGSVRYAAVDVDNASTQVSQASDSLSHGSTEQAASLEQVTSSLTEVTSQTRENADKAASANTMGETVRERADQGQQDMNRMVTAMSEVSESSQAIAKIIKVIDEIAFQTNLLALNAAVEAARAGRHGKGFAVVAEEVRNLAGRSATAAQETAQLIEGSVTKVGHTNKMVEQAATSLEAIIKDVTEMSGLVKTIAQASGEQSKSLTEVSLALQQVDVVTQQNTANAEQTSAAAQELSDQASKMKELISQFRLKDAHALGQAVEQFTMDDDRCCPTVTSCKPQPLPGKPGKSADKPPKKGKAWGTSAAAPPSGNWGGAQTPKPEEIISLDDDEFGKY